jgi:hypothetical protein
MLPLLPFLLLLLFTSSAAMANGLDKQLLAFVQNAVPEGRIVFRGEVLASDTRYALFVLQQKASRGILVVTGGSASSAQPFQVLFADTSFDFALSQNLIPSEAESQFVAWLGISPTLSNQEMTMASSNDVDPVGAKLNAVLGPIAGFTFKSNSTLEMLQELEQSDAIPVNPATAPAGSILICPTTYSPAGPVSLGCAVMLGSDRKIYGPDTRKGGAWHCFGLLEAWLAKHEGKNQLFGFLLRAHSEQRPM